jgi:hypothetical protein
MKKYILLLINLILLLISGCEQPGDDPNHCSGAVYNYDSEIVTQSGLVLKSPAHEMLLDIPDLENLYADMESCVGMTAPAPTVWYTSFKDRGLNGGWGGYLYANQIVMMNTDEGIVPRDCISDRETFKHESVHHILYMNGQDASHGNPMFAKCAIGVTVCNGKPC